VAKAALLDVDGTLIDANYHHALAWYRAFRQYDITLPIWRIHRAVGMGGDQLVPSLVGDEIDEEKGEDIRATRDKIFEGLIEEVVPFEGAHEFVVALLERDIAVVLASSSPEDDIEHYMGLLDLRTLVDGWTTKDDVDATKPEPDLVKAALAKVEDRQAIMVGDTKWDVEAAAKAGIETVGVTSGGWWRGELRNAGAVAVFDTVVELRERLDETPFAR
jgi:HAD superfamily hydrolase (TIGR01549 family)